jgi:hypothetical protein
MALSQLVPHSLLLGLVAEFYQIPEVLYLGIDAEFMSHFMLRSGMAGVGAGEGRPAFNPDPAPLPPVKSRARTLFRMSASEKKGAPAEVPLRRKRNRKLNLGLATLKVLDSYFPKQVPAPRV